MGRSQRHLRAIYGRDSSGDTSWPGQGAGYFPGASLDLNFATGRALVPRTNAIRNNTAQGAVAGNPGTMPTNWNSAATISGITRTVIGVGTENGVDGVYVQYSGTANATTGTAFGFDTSQGIAATNGQTWAQSVFLRLTAGTLNGVSFVHRLSMRDAAGAALSQFDTAVTPTGVLTRSGHVQTLNNASTAFVLPQLLLSLVNGATIDFTLFIGLPQLEQRGAATAPIRTFGTAKTVTDDITPMASLLTVARASPGMAQALSGKWIEFPANVLRITDRGLLVEEARTNTIRNNTMTGAVVGVPGTMPTNMSSSTGVNGINRAVVGLPVVNGVECVDINFSGTATGSVECEVRLETNLAIAAVAGQTWNLSTFFQVLQDDTDIGLIELQIIALSGAQAELGRVVRNTLKTATTSLQRFDITYPSLPTNTASLLVRVTTNAEITTGEVINFTMRIGLPQCEQGSFPSSPIRTSGAAVTRPVDIVTMPVSFVTGAHTIFGQLTPTSPLANPTNQVVFQLDTGSGAERTGLFRVNTSGILGLLQNTAAGTTGVQATSTGIPALPTDVSSKISLAVAPGDQMIAGRGALGVAGTISPLPSTPNRLVVGSNGGTSFLNGYIERVAVTTFRRSNLELKAA